MKKAVKIVLYIIIAAACIAGGIYYAIQPLAVNAVTISPHTAEMYFIEKGVVLALQRNDVYSAAAGLIVSLNAEEGQFVNKGDIICKIDDAEYRYEISQIESVIKGYEAQIAGLSSEERKARDQLELNRDSLLQELNVLEARQAGSLLSSDERERLKEEQARLQNIVIAQSENDLARAEVSVSEVERLHNIIINQNRIELEKAQENVRKIEELHNITLRQNRIELENANKTLAELEILYNVDAIPRFEYEEAEKAVQSIQTVLDKNETLAKQEYDTAVKAVQDAEVLLAKSEEQARQDYDKASAAVIAAGTALNQNRQQLNIIESGSGGNDNAYYQAMRQSLNAQIRGIESSMDKSYIKDTADYYENLIEQNKIAIERLQKRIADTEVRAPVSGTITTLNIKDTNMVSALEPIAVITTDKDCEVETFISVMDIGAVESGKNVSMTLKDRLGDKVIEGRVTQIDSAAVAKVSALGIEERKVKAIVTPDNPGVLKDGYDVDVRFTVFHEENSLTAPKTAFFKADDKDMLWVIKDGKAVMTEVVKGLELRTEFVVESGIFEGDVVIADASVSGLKEGANVTPADE